MATKNPNIEVNVEIFSEEQTSNIDPDSGKITVGTQTDDLKIRSLANISQPRKFTRPKTTLQQQQKWPELNGESTETAETDKCSTRNKGCQTTKTGVKRLAAETQMDSLRAVMFQRRKLSIDSDRERLEMLMEQINADPPPPWHQASLMWLEVDKLENRIEEFDKGDRSV